MINNLQQIEPRIESRLNRFVYCHHCQRMSEMTFLGRDAKGLLVFRCGVGWCGREVCIDLAGGETWVSKALTQRRINEH